MIMLSCIIRENIEKLFIQYSDFFQHSKEKKRKCNILILKVPSLAKDTIISTKELISESLPLMLGCSSACFSNGHKLQ